MMLAERCAPYNAHQAKPFRLRKPPSRRFTSSLWTVTDLTEFTPLLPSRSSKVWKVARATATVPRNFGISW